MRGGGHDVAMGDGVVEQGEDRGDAIRVERLDQVVTGRGAGEGDGIPKLVAGDEAGSKLDKANELGVPIIDELQLTRMIASATPKDKNAQRQIELPPPPHPAPGRGYRSARCARRSHWLRSCFFP